MTLGTDIEEAKLILENARRAQEPYFEAIIQLIERLEQERK